MTKLRVYNEKVKEMNDKEKKEQSEQEKENRGKGGEVGMNEERR